VRAAWQRDGLGLPKAVENERAEYKEESNVLEEFISDHLWREPSAWAWSGEVYKAYCAWCRARGETIGSQMALTQAIERTFNVKVSQDGHGRRRFLRLALRGQAVNDE
jgi:putative DNA primase/helicase